MINPSLIFQIFSLLNPLASFPLLMEAYKNKLNVKKIAIGSVIIAFIVAFILVFLGPFLFKLLHININSFRIAGGIVVFLLAIETIIVKQSKEKKYKKGDNLMAIIATPLLTGPATISFLTIKVYEFGYINIIINLFLACLLVAIIFILFSFTIKKINPTAINIASRVIGLFLAAIGIEMISNGIKSYFY